MFGCCNLGSRATRAWWRMLRERVGGWCSLVGADRPPKQAMPVARQEDLGLCVLWSLSLSLQSVPMFWCSLVGADRPPIQAMPGARQEYSGLFVLWSLSLSLQSVLRCKKVESYV